MNEVWQGLVIGASIFLNIIIISLFFNAFGKVAYFVFSTIPSEIMKMIKNRKMKS